MITKLKNKSFILFEATCPNDNCRNEFLVQCNTSDIALFCVKCGSKWTAKQK